MSKINLNYGKCNDIIKNGCPIELVLRVLGGKWKGIIIDALQYSPSYYNQLHRDIEGISRKVLTEQLFDLENYGIVSRSEINHRPKKVLYQLTEKGQEVYFLVGKINDILKITH